MSYMCEGSQEFARVRESSRKIRGQIRGRFAKVRKSSQKFARSSRLNTQRFAKFAKVHGWFATSQKFADSSQKFAEVREVRRKFAKRSRMNTRQFAKVRKKFANTHGNTQAFTSGSHRFASDVHGLPPYIGVWVTLHGPYL